MRPAVTDHQEGVQWRCICPGNRDLHLAAAGVAEDEDLALEDLPYVQSFECLPVQRMEGVSDSEPGDPVAHMSGSINGWPRPTR